MDIFSVAFNDYYYNVILADKYVIRGYFSYNAEGKLLSERDVIHNKHLEKIWRYFMGYAVDLTDIPIYFTYGTQFERKVWSILKEIPYGEVRSYKWVAGKIGNLKAARAVARAISKNPILVIVPCHRVIKSDGSIGGFTSIGGVELKRKLLALEGIYIKDCL